MFPNNCHVVHIQLTIWNVVKLLWVFIEYIQKNIKLNKFHLLCTISFMLVSQALTYESGTLRVNLLWGDHSSRLSSQTLGPPNPSRLVLSAGEINGDLGIKCFPRYRNWWSISQEAIHLCCVYRSVPPNGSHTGTRKHSSRQVMNEQQDSLSL